MIGDVAIVFPQRDAAALVAQMQRARKELGKSLRDVVAWAGTFVSSSLAASTKTAPKLRKIVENPDKRYKTDHRRAPLGVMAPKGPQRIMQFRPIFKTGEFGKIRFFDKKTASWFRHSPGDHHWEKLPSGPDTSNPELVVPGIMTDKRRIIGRRGLAAKSWRFLGKVSRRGGAVSVFDVSRAAVASWSGGSENPTLQLDNELRYAADAFKTKGRQAVDSAILRASEKMRNRITDRVAKKMGAK